MSITIIRADSSSYMGTGHIMRDLVLAKRDFKDFRVVFATRDLPGNINHKIIESGFEISLLKSDKIEELAELANKMDAETIVIDHYDIGYGEEKLLKESTGATLFALDDLYEKHFCDILLNHNVYAEPKRYEGLVPSHCELRCGKEYTLLRDEFYAAKQTPKLKRDKKDIFIAMGGTDHKNLIVKILRVLENIPDIEANVLTTRANRHLDELKEYAFSHSFVNLHIESNEVAKLMRKADLAISAPSVTMNEIIFMETPYIAIKTAENQNEMADYLDKNFLLNNFEKAPLYEMVVKRLYDDIEAIDFTKLTKDEHTIVLKWRNDPEIRRWMYNKNIISMQEHKDFIEHLKSTQTKKYYLVRREGAPIGVIDFTKIDSNKKSAHIGLYSRPTLKGHGSTLMKAIEKEGFGSLKLKHLIAEAFEDNKRAINLYKKFGYYIVSRRMIGKNEVLVMEKSI